MMSRLRLFVSNCGISRMTRSRPGSRTGNESSFPRNQNKTCQDHVYTSTAQETKPEWARELESKLDDKMQSLDTNMLGLAGLMVGIATLGFTATTVLICGQSGKIDGLIGKIDGHIAMIHAQNAKIDAQDVKIDGQKAIIHAQNVKIDGQIAKIELRDFSTRILERTPVDLILGQINWGGSSANDRRL